MGHSETAAGESASGLAAFILRRKTDILSEWALAVRELPAARPLTPPQLLDHMPQLLERFARAAAGEQEALGEFPEIHALERLSEGFDLSGVAREYALLRDCILRLWDAEPASAEPGAGMDAVRRLNRALDEAVIISVSRYARTRERTLVALDRISEAALESDDAERFLPRLLQVLLETTEAVDTALLFLREGELLRTRAAIGLEAEVAAGFSLPVGEGFVGLIAQDATPRELHSAATDPLVRSELLRARGVKGLYGVPLVEAEQVIGVAVMGSRSAHAFSQTDKMLFRTMVQRATMLLVQAHLRRTSAEFRERFLGIVSHDLRGPLNAIGLSASTLLQDESLGERHRRAVGRIAKSSERMGRMIRDLLDFTRGRLGGGIPIDPRPAHLTLIVRTVIEELELAYPLRALTLHCSGDLAGEWDPDRIAQAVGNLCKNALDYSPPDSTVGLSLEGDAADEVRLTVTNAGAPIPEAQLARLFDPFQRGEHSAARASGGLGLGLFIVQQIAEAHGGRVLARSDGEGTRFTLVLPRVCCPG